MNVNGQPGFFPLNKIRPHLTDYYMVTNGDVYSTKQYKTPKKMSGSTTLSGRYYTFTNKSRFPVTERWDNLFHVAQRHSDWKKDTSTAGEPPVPKAVTSLDVKMVPRDHADDTQQGIKAKGYIIGRVEGSAIVFGSKPVIHTSLKSVKDEVTRLAQKSPGTQIIYLKIEGAARTNAIVWE